MMYVARKFNNLFDALLWSKQIEDECPNLVEKPRVTAKMKRKIWDVTVSFALDNSQ